MRETPVATAAGAGSETLRPNYFPVALILIPLVLFAAATLSRYLKPAAPTMPPLPVYGAVPDFRLTDSDGREASRAELDGHFWIADFIFTRCSGTCVTMSTQMESLQRATAGTPDVRLVSFTVDPEHDTPEVLKEYAQHYHANPARWRFLTGPREALYTLAQEGFKLSATVDGKGLITHSDRLALVDAQGRIRGTYHGVDEEDGRKLLQDLERLYREPCP